MSATQLIPTEDEYADDILQPLSIDRFAEYKMECVKHLPISLRGHHYLELQERWITFLNASDNLKISKEISNRCKFNIYAHRNGNAKNCSIFGLTDAATDEDDYLLFIFTLQETSDEVLECLRKSKRIKWHLGPLLPSIHVEDYEVLNKLVWKQGVDHRSDWPKLNVCVWLPKEKARNFVYTIPNDIYVGKLTPEHAHLINDEWPHKSPKSINYIKSILTLNDDGIGLFDKSTNQLLCWVIATENFAAGFLQTVEAAQGRGFGTLIMKIYCKEFVNRFNLDLLAFIRVGNFISKKLFHKLGFEVYRYCLWNKLKTSSEYLK